MAAQLIDGKALAAQILAQVKQAAADFHTRYNRPPGLAVIQVGEHPASRIYVRNKREVGNRLGIASFAHDLPAETSEAELLARITRLNQQEEVDGILVQLPLPGHLAPEKILMALDPKKDVDGLHPLNLGRLLAGYPALVPCTPAGIMKMILSTETEIKGQQAVVVGRSNIVGKPTALLLLQAHATVTICHSRTRNLAAICQQADILVVAVGQSRCLPGAWIKPGAFVVDVGMNREEKGLCGDVEFETAREKAAFITPVPGGVGPMTIAMLMSNTVQAAQERKV